MFPGLGVAGPNSASPDRLKLLFPGKAVLGPAGKAEECNTKQDKNVINFHAHMISGEYQQ